MLLWWQDYVAASGAAPEMGARGYLDGPSLFAPHIHRWFDASQVPPPPRPCPHAGQQHHSPQT